MAEPQQQRALEPGDWYVLRSQVSSQVNHKLLNLALEIKSHLKDAPISAEDRNQLVTDMFDQFKSVADGQQTLGQLNDWLTSDQTRKRFAEAGVHSPLDKPFDTLLIDNDKFFRNNTPTLQSDGTVKRHDDVTFALAMEGGETVRYSSLADLKKVAGVESKFIAAKDRRPTYVAQHPDPDAQPEHTVKQATPDPKEILQWYTFLHDALPNIEKVYETPIKKGTTTETHEMTDAQRNGIEELSTKSTQLMAWLDKAEDGFHLNAAGMEHKAEAIALMKDIRKLAGHNEALTAYSVKMISITGPNEDHPDVEDQRGRPFLPNIQRDALNKMDDFRRKLENGQFSQLETIPALPNPPAPETAPEPARRGEIAPPAPSAPATTTTISPTMGQYDRPTRDTEWARMVADIYPGKFNSMVVYAPDATQHAAAELPKPRVVMADNMRSNEIIVTI